MAEEKTKAALLKEALFLDKKKRRVYAGTFTDKSGRHLL